LTAAQYLAVDFWIGSGTNLAADFRIGSNTVFGCRFLNWQQHSLAADL
jgi:hypothetical protein